MHSTWHVLPLASLHGTLQALAEFSKDLGSPVLIETASFQQQPAAVAACVEACSISAILLNMVVIASGMVGLPGCEELAAKGLWATPGLTPPSSSSLSSLGIAGR